MLSSGQHRNHSKEGMHALYSMSITAAGPGCEQAAEHKREVIVVSQSVMALALMRVALSTAPDWQRSCRYQQRVLSKHG
jgi:hypothetical protein